MTTTSTGGTPKAPEQREPWSRADRINFCGFLIALVVAVIAVVPVLINTYESHFDAPGAAITSLSNGQRLPNNRISVSGTSKHVPTDSDLWLTVSGPSDQVYPIAELSTSGKWNATEQRVCFRLGPDMQRLDVWLAPDTADGAFVGYMQTNHTTGFNSVPDGFVKKAQVTITIQKLLSRC
jgi:hypothetical protein